MIRRSMRYDDTNMRSAMVGKTGVTPREWTRILPRLRAAKKAVLKLARTGDQGFLDLPFDRKTVKDCERVSRKLAHDCTDLVVLGIGGSDLGARALHQALVDDGVAYRGMRLHFSGSSTDPDELSRLLKKLNLKRTCVNVISKSGDTLETMSAFLIFRDRLAKAVGHKRMAERIIATTDPECGSLRTLAKKEGYTTLNVPGNVGGRWSVLSSVGLFPASASGIDVDALLRGGRDFVDSFHECTPSECPSMRYAALHVIGMEQRRQNVHVTMPYVARLSSFAQWVKQLVAESLGKRLSRQGKTVHAGPTPVNAVGPEDQHSQMQLYHEGPFDKLITFIELDEFTSRIETPSAKGTGPSIERFGNREFADLIHLERRATAESLRQMKRSNGTLSLSSLDARSMGELILFWETAVAIMGELMDVNAYDQPGVELSKSIMRKELSA